MSPSQHPNHGEAVLNDMENRVPYPHVASEEDLRAHFITLAFRDLCSQHMIYLMQCRTQTHFLPWKCHPEKKNWEICEYKDFTRRLRKATRLRAEAEAEGTGPIPRTDEKFARAAELQVLERNQDMTPGKPGPYHLDDVIKGEKDGIRKTGH